MPSKSALGAFLYIVSEMLALGAIVPYHCATLKLMGYTNPAAIFHQFIRIF